MKFLIDGYWQKNLGDDLFLKVLCDRYPDTQFEVLMYPEIANDYEDFNNLEVKKFKFGIFFRLVNKLEKWLNHIVPFSRNYQLLSEATKVGKFIEIGGSIFILPSNPAKTGLDFLRRNKILRNVDSYSIIGSNFGPYHGEKQLVKYKSFFEKVDYICFRDKWSQQLFNHSHKAKYAPDIVFNLNTENLEQKEEYKNSVLISIVDPLRKGKDRETAVQYENYIINTITSMKATGVKSVLMAFCEYEGDLNFAKQIYKKLDKDVAENTSIYLYRDVRSALSVIKSAKYLIASRYHAMILGWILQKPTYVISYSKKTTNVIKDLFPSQKFVNMEDNKLLNKKVEFSIMNDELVRKCKNRARVQFEYLDSLIKYDKTLRGK